jgi:hypothetical protein
MFIIPSLSNTYNSHSCLILYLFLLHPLSSHFTSRVNENCAKRCARETFWKFVKLLRSSCLKRNLDMTETIVSGKFLQSQGSKLQVPVLNAIWIKRGEKNSVHCGSVRDRLYCTWYCNGTHGVLFAIQRPWAHAYLCSESSNRVQYPPSEPCYLCTAPNVGIASQFCDVPLCDIPHLWRNYEEGVEDNHDYGDGNVH